MGGAEEYTLMLAIQMTHLRNNTITEAHAFEEIVSFKQQRLMAGKW